MSYSMLMLASSLPSRLSWKPLKGQSFWLPMVNAHTPCHLEKNWSVDELWCKFNVFLRPHIPREIQLQLGGNHFQNPISCKFLSLHPCRTSLWTWLGSNGFHVIRITFLELQKKAKCTVFALKTFPDVLKRKNSIYGPHFLWLHWFFFQYLVHFFSVWFWSDLKVFRYDYISK